jgi:DNA-binding transcriptional LysR family regulator
VVLTLGSSEAVALSVQQGIGVAFISKTVVERLVPEGVIEIKIKDFELAQDIYLGRQPRRPATTAQSAFWDMVTTQESAKLAAIKKNLHPVSRSTLSD